MDIYVLIDTSKSMLVSDIAPDRISVAKKIVDNLLDNLEGDRIGFIPFASGAYIQMPLTDDYLLARMFLNVMDTDMISSGGTNLAAAIGLANDSFERVSDADRVILIISDGEEHDLAGQNVLKKITDNKLRIYTIGIGTEKGGLVPIYDKDGNSVVDYMEDGNGNPVTSRLDANNLKKLARDGNGVYYQANSQGVDVDSLLMEFSHLDRDVQTVEKIRRFKQLFQYFLGVGILLFMIAWFLPERRRVVF
jgi:Ca-activated chloride channel family protein